MTNDVPVVSADSDHPLLSCNPAGCGTRSLCESKSESESKLRIETGVRPAILQFRRHPKIKKQLMSEDRNRKPDPARLWFLS
jgi:hypothetical protein